MFNKLQNPLNYIETFFEVLNGASPVGKSTSGNDDDDFHCLEPSPPKEPSLDDFFLLSSSSWSNFNLRRWSRQSSSPPPTSPSSFCVWFDWRNSQVAQTSSRCPKKKICEQVHIVLLRLVQHQCIT